MSLPDFDFIGIFDEPKRYCPRSSFGWNKSVPIDERNQFGVTLAGPIFKDHTFFFINYEGLRKRKGITTNISVPHDYARQGLLPSVNGSSLVNIGVNPTSALFIGLYPRPNGPELAVLRCCLFERFEIDPAKHAPNVPGSKRLNRKS